MKTSRAPFWLLVALILLPSSLRIVAAEFENGDFAKGKFRWEGDGHIGFVDKDGTIEPADPSNDVNDGYDVSETAEKTPFLEMKLNRINFKRIWEKFTVPDGAKQMKVTILYKGSPGFQRNNKSPNYTYATTSTPGESLWSYYDPLYPKVDMFARLDKNDDEGGCLYKLGAVKAGTEWQTLNAEFTTIHENTQVTINIFAAPGDGSLYVKSVAVKWVK